MNPSRLSAKLVKKLSMDRQTGRQRISSQARMMLLIKTPQFYWFWGHTLSIFTFLLSILFGFFSLTQSLRQYRLSLFFELLSYGIVINQSYSKGKRTAWQQKLVDANVQYFVYALGLLAFSFITKPVSGTLYSYVIYSFFHAITYFQANLLQALPISLTVQSKVSSQIDHITIYNEQALLFAAAAEVLVISNFAWSIPGFVLNLIRTPFQAALRFLFMIFCIGFVKLRYDDSQSTRLVMKQVDSQIGGTLAHPAVPSQIYNFYQATLKGFIRTYIEPIKLSGPSVTKKNQ